MLKINNFIFQIEYSKEQECIIEADDPEGGWVDTHHYETGYGGLEERVSEMTLEEAQPTCLMKPNQSEDENDDDDDEEEAVDMEAFEISGMLDEQDKVHKFSFFIHLI